MHSIAQILPGSYCLRVGCGWGRSVANGFDTPAASGCSLGFAVISNFVNEQKYKCNEKNIGPNKGPDCKRTWPGCEDSPQVVGLQIIDDCVFFKYLVPRGEAYDKKYEEKLRKDDNI